MLPILKYIPTIFDGLNTYVAGAPLALYDHLNNPDHIQETKNTIKEASKKAYRAYCECRIRRPDELGQPDEAGVISYWLSCLERNVLPCEEDMLQQHVVAAREEAHVMFPLLLSYWMEIPDFASWWNALLLRTDIQEVIRGLNKLGEFLQPVAKLPDMAELLADLPKIYASVSALLTHFQESEAISSLATPLGPGEIEDARCHYSERVAKSFYQVNSGFKRVMLPVMSAGQDVPYEAAERKMAEFLESGAPIIIAGNGGFGKTSLMLRTAVQWADSGKLAVWLALSARETIRERDADAFFESLLQSVPPRQKVLLCIDNPYEGRDSLLSLQSAWPYHDSIQLLMAERSNRLTLLSNTDQNALRNWFDSANALFLGGDTDKALTDAIPGCSAYSIPEDPKRRKEILRRSLSFLVEDDENAAKNMKRFFKKYDKPSVSLVDMIYGLRFECASRSSRDSGIRMDWDEWGDFLKKELFVQFHPTELYGTIAAFKIFGVPLSLSAFCGRFQLDRKALKSHLQARQADEQTEPLIYDMKNGTLEPKHDASTELFFRFHSKMNVNSLIMDAIEFLDTADVCALLQNIVRKKEIDAGEKEIVGQIKYREYFRLIEQYQREKRWNLPDGVQAFLCLGLLWTALPNEVAHIKRVMAENMPAPWDILPIEILYTEYGIWAKDNGDAQLALETFQAINTASPYNVPSRTELGRLLAEQGRADEAEVLFQEAITIDPKTIHARTELGRLLAKQGQLDEAKALFREVIKDAPKDVHARVELGKLLAKQGQPDEAEILFRKVIEIDDKNLPAHIELGKLLVEEGQPDEAEEFFQEAITIDPKTTHARVELGRLLAEQGRMDEVEPLLQEILRLNPADFKTQTELGILLAKQSGKEEDAKRHLKAAIAMDEGNHARIELARILVKQGLHKEAEGVFQEIVRINPQDVYSWTEFGSLLAKQPGRGQEAEKAFQQAIDIQPNNISGWNGLGALHKKNHRDAEAIKAFRKAVALPSANSRTKCELARLLAKQPNGVREAEQIFQEVVEQEPDNAYAWIGLGVLCKNNHRDAEAIEAFRKAVVLPSANSRTKCELARLLAKQPDSVKEAEKIFREVIAQEPNDFYARTDLGKVLARQEGREEEVEEVLLPIRKIAPRQIQFRTILAKMYERHGEKRKAAQMYREICDIRPDDLIAQSGLARLQDSLNES